MCANYNRFFIRLYNLFCISSIHFIFVLKSIYDRGFVIRISAESKEFLPAFCAIRIDFLQQFI